MKAIVFDTGPFISLAMNSLLEILGPLEKNFDGDFYITPAVYRELVEVPFETKKFKFEALRIMRHIDRGTIRKIDNSVLHKETKKLLETANKIFKSKGNWIKIVHHGEMEAITAAINLDAKAFVIDERTTRSLIEDPMKLKRMMEKKLHSRITVNRANLSEFRKMTKGIRMIRSTELVMIAYEMGILDKYLPKMKDARKQLLQSVLWAVKLDGCAISQNEIDEIIKRELSA